MKEWYSCLNPLVLIEIVTHSTLGREPSAFQADEIRQA